MIDNKCPEPEWTNKIAEYDDDYDESEYEAYQEMDRDYKADMDEFDKAMETYEGDDMSC